MAIGTVKWFNNAKGYGFILPDGGGEDLFAHYSSIQMDGYKTLKAGQSVHFEIIEGPKGLQATNIQYAGGAEDVTVDGEMLGDDAVDGQPATSEVLSVTVDDGDTDSIDEVDGNRIGPSQASRS
jgi:CspA family cold shock protein